MDTSSFFKKIGKGSWLVLWRVILPFSAIRQSVKLAKKEVDRNKENLVYLRDLKNQAFKTLKSPENSPAENEANDTQQVEVGFEEAMRSRSEGALPVPQLYRLFLIKKRLVLNCHIRNCAPSATRKNPGKVTKRDTAPNTTFLY